MNKFTLAGVALTLIVVGIAMWMYWPVPTTPVIIEEPKPEPVVEAVVATSSQTVIGSSVQGRDIAAHTFGTGDTNLLFVGGIHGGYEANTVGLAEAMVDQLHTNPTVIPENITVHIIPNLNPDGYALPTTASDFDRRMNANGVDLNRNFDCLWTPESSWRSETVSGGTEPFSEPEAVALRDYVASIENSLAGAVFWHSKANAVYTSECGLGTGAAPGGDALMNTYASAANYQAFGMWTAYPVTGAAEDWLASLGIPAITVELETRDSIEWERNLAATIATLELYR
jgi:hypothetical protein